MSELHETCCPVAETILQEPPAKTSAISIPLSNSTPGQTLLRHREIIFEQISREENLNELIYHFLVMSSLFAVTYGFALGSYSNLLQMISSALKVPALLFVTLAVCFPALFTFNVLMGSCLSFKQTLSVLMSMTYIISVVLSAFAPILLFFSITGATYKFMILLNVLMFTLAGLGGIITLWTQMEYLSKRCRSSENRAIIAVWLFIYMFVGTQMAWTLRPFVSSGGLFTFFRDVEGNFYTSLYKLIVHLF